MCRFTGSSGSGSSPDGESGTDDHGGSDAEAGRRRRPAAAVAFIGILLPVVLMLGKSVADAIDPSGGSALHAVFDFIGNPPIALPLPSRPGSSCV